MSSRRPRSRRSGDAPDENRTSSNQPCRPRDARQPLALAIMIERLLVAGARMESALYLSRVSHRHLYKHIVKCSLSLSTSWYSLSYKAHLFCVENYLIKPLVWANIAMPLSINWIASAASRMPRMRETTRMPVRPMCATIQLLLRIAAQAAKSAQVIAAATETRSSILGVAISTYRIVVAIVPGPAIMGIASGKTLASSHHVAFHVIGARLISPSPLREAALRTPRAKRHEVPQRNHHDRADQRLEERHSVEDDLAGNGDQYHAGRQPDADEGRQEGTQHAQGRAPADDRFGDNADNGGDEPVDELRQCQRKVPAREVCCHNNDVREHGM